MKLIVGLGNPGRAYVGSRHNIGFLVVEALAKECGVKLKKTFGRPWVCAKAEIEGSNVLLAEPLTYMNLSGRAVATLLKKNKIGLNNLLVVCDDLDLSLGRLKIRDNGSSGGQRGLESIIGSLASREFSRLRVGIGRPGNNMDAADYVLSQFDKAEKKAVVEIVERACACVRSWIAEGTDKTMNTFNKHPNL